MYAIRALEPADAESFVILRRAMLVDTPWAFASSPEIDRGCKPELVRDSVSRDGSTILGAFDNNALIGAAGLVRDEKPKRHHIVSIWGVYVTPTARGAGLGRRIVEAAIATARTWPGVACVQLTVSEKAIAARRLYESQGFTAWGLEPDALRVDGVTYDESHMRLAL